MNKLLTKIVGVVLGTTMAVGVGVGVAANNDRKDIDSQVNATAYSGTFDKLTGNTIETGKRYLLSYGTYLCGNTVSSNRLTNSSTAITSGVASVTNPDNSAVWTIGTRVVENVTYYTFYNEAIQKYLLGNTSQARANVGSVNDTTACWSLTASNNTFDFQVKGGTRLLHNNGTSGWASYASTTGGALTLYKEVVSSTPSISVNKTAIEVVENDLNGAEFTITYANTQSDFIITSSDENEDYVMLDYTAAHGVSGNTTVTVYGLQMTTSPVTLTISQDGVADDIEVSVSVKSDNVVTVTSAGGVVSLKQGATLQLSASSSKGDDTFAWSSSNTNVATVSNSGLVTGVASGSVTITAASNTYAGTSGTKDLTVTFSSDYSRAVFYNSEQLENSSGSEISNASTIKNYFNGASTTIDSVSYSNMLSINKLGGLSLGSGKKAGSFTITMKTGYYLKSVSLWGARVDSINTPTISGAQTPTLLNNGGALTSKSAVMDGVVPLTWTFATASSSVTFSSTSSTRFTVYQLDLVWTTITPTSISLGDDTAATLMATEKKQLTTVVSPQNYNVDPGITWQTSNSSAATVSNGLITAVAVGSATITASSAYGSPTCVVTVIALQASSVTIRPATVSTLTGVGTETLKISGKEWQFVKTNKYDTGDTNDAYTRGSIRFDNGSVTNNDKYSFKIKKVIVAHCIKEDGSALPTSFTVAGSDTQHGTDVSTTSVATGIITTYTLASAVDYVTVSCSVNQKMYFASITFEFAEPSESIYSVAEYIMGLSVERDDVIGACTMENGTYLAAKQRMAMLSAAQRGDFQTSEDLTVVAARTRYEIWAGNNHDSSPYDGELAVQPANGFLGNAMTENQIVIVVAVIISVISLSTLCGYFLLRKRKEER